MNETINIVRLRQPGEIDDPLTDVLRTGARKLLAQAIEMDAEGHRKVNRRLMKMCEHGPCQKLLVIRFIVATAFPPRALRTR
ncbi:hypothetical protein ACVILI_006515 [Mesorhizobium sp. USDA 4775]|nr:hypothetical protein [Mesorhizobium jarvisii]MCH4561199.1 hypothetical protein [Mesorhizobium jarvisii]QGU21043.1 hypothetical protein MCHK_11390 [Mesorhizobium huakuii 7653R]